MRSGHKIAVCGACVVAALSCRYLASPSGAAELTPNPDAVAFFEKEIRPVLVNQCRRCHGPQKQESGFRVDSRAAVLKGGVSGPGVVPGKPQEGTLLAALRHDGGIEMPPDGKLSPQQIAAFSKWIQDGAVWPADEQSVAGTMASIFEQARRHWAFQPVTSPTPPTVRDQTWPATEIDRFILAKLEAQGLKPAKPADKRTLLRRVTYDLTGLPPTPEEIEAFLQDESAGAFDKVVERLLASPHYGERWGRHWLDVARYADTAGDGADYPVREAYKYRDWVIAAISADMPVNEFIRRQIAGDILAQNASPGEYADLIKATGFLAIGKRYGYAPNADFQHLDFADVIDSVGRSILGLSLGCARCHDHKYEPVTVEDYYALYGILQSTTWAFPGGEEHKRPASFPALVPDQEVARLVQERQTELHRHDEAIAKLKAERSALDGSARVGGVDLGFEEQKLGVPPSGAWLSEGPNQVLAEAQSPFHHIHPPGTRGVRIGTGKPINGVRYVFPTPLRAGTDPQMHFSIDFRTVEPANQSGSYRFYLGRGVIASLAVEFSVSAREFAIKNGANWEVIRKLEPAKWYTLQIQIDPVKKTYSGVVGQPNDLIAFREKAVAPGWDGVIDTFICDGIGHVAGPAPVRDLDNIGLSRTAFPVVGSPAVAEPTPTTIARLAELDNLLVAAQKAREAVAARVLYDVAYAVREGTPTNARIQLRGEPDRLGKEVPRRFLQILGGDPVPPGKGSGRLELAEWLTRPSNPLTARVFVNRVWQWHFGNGLVTTPSDFGLRGSPPSHPELLDFLASRFIATGWSLKELHRLILRSKVYQQSSLADAATLAADPANVWLGRFPRRPLDAESIRDSMLAISGVLDRTPSGPHPFPPVETWAFTIHNPFHAVYDSNRRSVYLMTQRNRRHPFLALFDAADPNLSVDKRTPTITPTQALYLMNSPFVHAQAEAFARRLLKESPDDPSRIRRAFELAHGRLPSDREIAAATTFLNHYHLEQVNTLPTSSTSSATSSDPAVAAWAALARVLLTSNAFLYVD